MDLGGEWRARSQLIARAAYLWESPEVAIPRSQRAKRSSRRRAAQPHPPNAREGREGGRALKRRRGAGLSLKPASSLWRSAR